MAEHPKTRPSLPEPFSVLLPVYRGDDAGFFTRAVESVTAEQTRRPDELVVVVDGPVPAAIATALARIEAGEVTGGVPVRVVALPRNVGLARALEAGLDACAHEVVARADADDISLPDRFEIQVPMVESGLDLIGSAIVEFVTEDGPDQLVRALPCSQAEISVMARFRDPFNHPSVVYRRSAVRAAGGYEHLDKMEDYWLFARMIAAGAQVANTEKVLVRYRVGAGAYGRRGGSGMLASEARLQWRLLRLRFTTKAQFVRNIAVRGLYRFVPVTVRARLYRTMVRESASMR